MNILKFINRNKIGGTNSVSEFERMNFGDKIPPQASMSGFRRRSKCRALCTVHYALFTMFFALCTMLLLSGCVNDAVEEPVKSTVLPDKVYIELNVTIPGSDATRSQTEENGGSSGDANGKNKTEPGMGNESTIESATLYFYQKVREGVIGNYLLSLNASNTPVNSTINENPFLKAEIKKDDVEKLLLGQELYLFVVANTTNYTTNSEGIDGAILNFNDDYPKSVGTGDYVPMVNYDYYEVDLSQVSDFENFVELLDEGNIFNVSEKNNGEDLQLERCVARVDYKPTKLASNGVEANVYKLGDYDLYVKITGLQPFNIKQQSYLFRHTMAGTSEKSNYGVDNNITPDLFGVERDSQNSGFSGVEGSYRWVADIDWGEKLERLGYCEQDNSYALPGGDYFNNQPKKNESGEYGLAGDNYTKVDDENLKDLKNLEDGYYPLWYISENTLPSTAAMMRGLSTGVAFRVILCKDDSGDPLLDSDISAENSSIEVEAITSSSNFFNVKYNNEVKAIAEKLSDGSYAMTYWYMMEHNALTEAQGHEAGVMDAMQFAVVRNNIYKLSVSKFSGFPDPFDPNEPDEPETGAAISVNVMVLPWAKHDISVTW